tara:strand:- start:2499 stop:3488 length:990 start_codon:yes stop_codon:yes gene_type:complete
MMTAEIQGPRRLDVNRVPIPEVGADDALLRIHACGICGSDVHRYLVDAYGSRFRYPLNSGHEFAGEVVTVGEHVTGFKPGEWVTGHPSWVEHGGAFAEYLLILDADRNLISLGAATESEALDPALISLIEPVTVGLNALKQCTPSSGPDARPHIVILGGGTIGLCVLLAAQAHGHTDIVVSEPSSLRRDIAESLGARTVESGGDDGLERLRAAVNADQGADIVIECAGSEDSIAQAVEIVARGGTLMMVALSRTAVGIPLMSVVTKGLKVLGMTGAPLDAYASEAIEILGSRGSEILRLVTHRFPLADARDAFELACDPDSCCKILIEP